MSSMWLLCLRKVRPSVAHIGSWETARDSIAGNGYSFTEQGKKWLREDPHSILLVASQSYARIVAQYSQVFGEDFVERAHDAIKCYDAGAYLACCAMCGAACESIYLALAVAKSGDAVETLKMYRASDGRKRLKSTIEHGKAGGLIRTLDSGFNVLAYWRDMSAHGHKSNIGRDEASSALKTLLELSQLCSDRWIDLTDKSKPIQPL